MRVGVDAGLPLVLCQLTGFGAKFWAGYNPGGGGAAGVGQSLTQRIHLTDGYCGHRELAGVYVHFMKYH